jgi:hypothetical protein
MELMEFSLFWIIANMSWQVQQHFDRIMRRYDNFEK